MVREGTSQYLPPLVPVLLRIASSIDSLHRRIGSVASWLTLAMVLLGALNALVRYLDRSLGARLSSNAWFELQWYLFGLVFLLGAPYVLRRDGHVRVDVIYGRLPARARAWIDLVGTALLLVPWCALAAWLCWPFVRDSWDVREGSPDPGGLPRYPIKAVVLLSFVLLGLQGLSELLKRFAILRGWSPEAVGLAEDGRGEGAQRGATHEGQL